MSGYRDERETLRRRAADLEAELAEARVALEELEPLRAERDALVERVAALAREEPVPERRAPRSRYLWILPLAGLGCLFGGVVAGGDVVHTMLAALVLSLLVAYVAHAESGARRRDEPRAPRADQDSKRGSDNLEKRKRRRRARVRVDTGHEHVAVEAEKHRGRRRR